jgi:hypothetical protein
VSVDQYVSAMAGRLHQTKKKEQKKDKFCGCLSFVNHASLKVFI